MAAVHPASALRRLAKGTKGSTVTDCCERGRSLPTDESVPVPKAEDEWVHRTGSAEIRQSLRRARSNTPMLMVKQVDQMGDGLRCAELCRGARGSHQQVRVIGIGKKLDDGCASA
jgi:hypothetical protein